MLHPVNGYVHFSQHNLGGKWGKKTEKRGSLRVDWRGSRQYQVYSKQYTADGGKVGKWEE